jgi:hypothetical protein
MFAADTVPKVLVANPRIRLIEVDAGHNAAGDNPGGFHREARRFLESGLADTEWAGDAPARAHFRLMPYAQDKAAPGNR